MENEITVDQLIARLQEIKQTHGGETPVSLAATDDKPDAYALTGSGIAMDELDGHAIAIIYAAETLTGMPSSFAPPFFKRPRTLIFTV